MLDIVFGLLSILAILLLSIGVVVALVAAYREDKVRALNPDYRGQHRTTSQWGKGGKHYGEH